ncbi:TnsD family Tn7-like transposition protein [Paenibacillus sp. YYML68]|uniref:TnsD family Tn7-like transposition protein n=1 Tax=Paenibacillus sp. YYML68 TaxID=2909250 RepID=UPI002493C8C0|nr:TnsD family Tn7-like transposition protein [Paenibacillus sp. YYML68]
MDQIVQFPTPLPGEDFRSVLYRYHLYTLNTEMADTNQELFENRSRFSVFPRGLEVFIRKLQAPTLFQTDKIVEHHTLLPLFLPFMTDGQVESIIHEVKHGAISNSLVGKLVGNKYGKSISDGIRYCPCCISEDWSKYGCSYVHREHQLAFISKCYDHNVKLISQCSVCNEDLMYSMISGKCRNGHEHITSSKIMIKEEVDTLEKELYTDLQYLFENHKKITGWLIKQRFLEYLHSKDYLGKNGGTIKRAKLVKDLIARFPSETLRKFRLDEQYIMQRNAFEKIFWSSPLVINLPLCLLVIRFLAGSLECFITKGIPYACEIPFTNGPWQCQNKYCPSYLRYSINSCTRVSNGYRGILARFQCYICQGEYTTEWMWKGGIKKTNYKLINYPKEKDQRVMEMMDSGFSPDDVSKKLNCSPDYVKVLARKHIKNNQLTLFNIGEVAAAIEGVVEDPKKERCRNILLSTIRQNPKLSRYKLSLKCITEYTWLKRHDNNWLEQQLPTSRSTERFDWSEVDYTLEARVREVAKQLIDSNPSSRVARYTIMRFLSKSENNRIKNNTIHLPRTNQALNECAETVEQYQIRHLPALVWQLRNHYDYREITIDSIMSYRRSYRGISDNMKSLLTECLKSL